VELLFATLIYVLNVNAKEKHNAHQDKSVVMITGGSNYQSSPADCNHFVCGATPLLT
jgi:hypothetical protein